jgi:translocation and assembly module TamA
MKHSRTVFRLLPIIALVAASMLPFASRAADIVPYSVQIQPTGDKALDSALAGSSQLAALRTRAPAGPFALVTRARQDTARLRTVLDSFGYYQATLAASIAGHSLDAPDLPDILQALPAGQTVKVAIAIDRGVLFHLRHVTLQGQVPPSAQAQFRLAPGQPAIAASVLAAGDALLTALQEDGYALARVDPPLATEIPAEHALDVSFHVVSGPRVDLGAITITGLRRTNQRYVRRRLILHPGERYKPSAIEAAREDLAATGIFSGVKISAAQHLSPDGRLPLRVDVTERRLHTVSLDAAFSTDLGGSLGATWTYRNLFGNAETLTLTADATGLGGSDSKGLGYLAKADFQKPDFTHRDETLDLYLEALKQDLDSYDQTAAIAGGSLSRKLSKLWTASLGLTATREQILQEGVTRDYTLLALPLTGRFDSTAVPQPFDDPTHGVRATLLATPTESLSGQNATFVILQATAATYFDLARFGLSPPGHSVIAVRGLLGSVQGAGVFQLPPDQRFYAGGSATVRGFKYQSVGPLFTDGNPVGGTSIDAATVELRQRLWKQFGAVAFLDAAQVGSSSAPFAGSVREGVGIGARYYTAIGPLRLDVAVPVNPSPHGDSFEIYLGLGQAF